MIVTVTLNVSLDKTYSVPGFKIGQDVSADRVEYSPGGKGLNVASFARTLGADVTATGIVAGHAGRHVRQLLTDRGIAHDFIEVPGESRSCHIIHDPADGSLTQIREAGPTVPSGTFEAIAGKIRALAPNAETVVFSGSAPGGLGADVYRELVLIARAAGPRVILDAAGELLELGLRARPTLIKPNFTELDELAQRLGLPRAVEAKVGAQVYDPADTNDRDRATATLRWATDVSRAVRERYEIEAVVASLGPSGAVVVGENFARHAMPPAVNAVNTVSCGDALVAGITVGWHRGFQLMDSVQLGVATATAKALLFQTGQVNPTHVQRLLPQVISADV